MSGQDGNRGYLIQSVIALLESLNHSDWHALTLEPTHASDKIDISWHGASATRACQVKSSINQINRPDVKKWAAEFEAQSTEDELTLILVGPCSSSVARMCFYGKVAIPSPKSLDFEEMFGFAAHLLDRFLAQEKINAQSPIHRELMARALVTELSIFASNGSPIERRYFIELLKKWVKGVAAPVDQSWELVDFSHQRGIENAIAGKRLGPADVNHCPEFTICGQVVTELKRSHWYSIVGQLGCGKSITAWQAAKKFHDGGYSVWRPHYNAEADELLKGLPTDSPSLLVIDDAQQFESGFIERLSEYSCESLKVIFTSTLADIVTPNPSCISPTSGVDKLKTSMLERRHEILPIVQRFDDRISDKYMDVSFERRVDDCARQKTPWEFFWVLRGGWRTARAEYESLKQVPNANLLVTTIALRQISSCDAGISRNRLFHISGELGLTVDETDKAISHLASLGLVLISDDIFRTKHISYAYRIVEESLSKENCATWLCTIDTFIATALDDNTSLKGVYWLLEAVQMTDASRYGHLEKLRPVLDRVMSRCRNEWLQSEWAVGCASSLFKLFRLSVDEILADEELLLRWFTAGTGRIARFSSSIANDLINSSDKEGSPETADVAKSLFEKVNSALLVELANGVKLDDFFSFGDLLNRLAFYRPLWSETFLSQIDWPRMLRIILDTDARYSYAVDKLVGSLSFLGARGTRNYNLEYVEDIVPFIVRAISEDPISTINSMHDVFWRCLGFAPRFLRGGVDPDERQLQIARSIVAQLDPTDFALVMKSIVSRDMETLARSLSIIREVDAEFISRVALLVPENFHIAARIDWRTQSDELRHLLSFFCIGTERQPARNWVTFNKGVIEEPLDPMFAGIAPQVAVNFHKAGKRVNLTRDHQQRWLETVWAISAIENVDKDVCIEIVTDQLDALEAELYKLSLDSPKYIVLFFRLIHELSCDLFSDFVDRLDMDNPKAIKTIRQLAKSQPKERANYKKLARLACRIGGDVGAIGESFLMRLEKASELNQTE
ncbi:MAG: CBS domain-containing protein [Desulfobulbaceae bacterium]